jgi:biotin-(acetyl-CoA carboxylase) ligase
MEEWKDWDALAEQKVQVSMGKDKVIGKAMGIDSSGGLRLKLRNGRMRTVQAGEVTLRK